MEKDIKDKLSDKCKSSLYATYHGDDMLILVVDGRPSPVAKGSTAKNTKKALLEHPHTIKKEEDCPHCGCEMGVITLKVKNKEEVDDILEDVAMALVMGDTNEGMKELFTLLKEIKDSVKKKTKDSK